MSPILLGILDQGVAGGGAGGFYESIATVSVGAGGQSSVSFTSIPADYKHLQLRAFITAWASGGNSDYLRINGDSGSNYTWHYLVGTGSSAGAGAATSQTGMQNYFGTAINNVRIIDFLDYTSNSKYKTVRSLVGGDNNGSGSIWLESNLWLNTAAITSLTFNIDSNNVAQYSHFALYGIKD